MALGVSLEYEIAREHDERDVFEAAAVVTYERNKWHWALNLLLEDEISSAEEAEWGYALGARYAVEDQHALGLEVLATAAAGVFYGLYKSVQVMTPEADSGDIACWGVNSCKGTSACTTAFNACTGQNACKGRGYRYVSAEECEAQGGQPLAGSPGDPARG